MTTANRSDTNLIIAKNVLIGLAKTSMSRPGLATAIGMEYGALCRRINGTVGFGATDVVLIAGVFGTEPGALLTDHDAAVAA